MNAQGPPLICVVDDDSSVRRALARLIVSCGLAVETYASAPDYLAAPHPCSVACLILDIHLGEMSGFELQEQLTSSGSLPPVIFITAFDDVVTRARADKCGAAGFYRKPFEGPSLLAAIGRVIGRDLDPLGPQFA